MSWTGFAIATHSIWGKPHKDKYPDRLRRIGQLIKEKKLTLTTDILKGFEHLPTALERIYSGLNAGKQLVRIHS